MNCNEFQQQFQRWIDQRQTVPDQSIQEHAGQCEACRRQLRLWQAIQPSLTQHDDSTNLVSHPTARKSMRSNAIVALAVTACLVIAIVKPRTSGPFVDSQSLTSIRPPLAEMPSAEVNLSVVSDSQLRPGDWWDDIRDRDWVSRTMPTVRIVRDGVAPLGRSIQRAATLLTTAPREQTS